MRPKLPHLPKCLMPCWYDADHRTVVDTRDHNRFFSYLRGPFLEEESKHGTE